jgi:hypothetical protein
MLEQCLLRVSCIKVPIIKYLNHSSYIEAITSGETYMDDAGLRL